MKNILLLFLFIPLLLQAQSENFLRKKGIDTDKHIPEGLPVGAEAPMFEAFSLSGDKIDTREILKKKKIVLIFYRGKWCPQCNRYLSNLSDSLKLIKDAEVLVVGSESFENSRKTSRKTNASFILIPDTSLKILKAYDVLFYVTRKYGRMVSVYLMKNLAKSNGQEEAVLPVPATYIIGQDGKILWRHFDYDYSRRASVKDILEHL